MAVLARPATVLRRDGATLPKIGCREWVDACAPCRSRRIAPERRLSYAFRLLRTRRPADIATRQFSQELLFEPA